MSDLRAAAALLLLLLLVPAPPAAAGEEPRDTALAAEVEDLVRRLGSSSFEEREAAYEKLREMGTRIAPYLEPSLESEDPEVARLVRRLLSGLKRRAEEDLLILLDTRDPGFASSPELERLVARGRALMPALMKVLDEEDAQFPSFSYYRLNNAYLVLGRLAKDEDIDVFFARLTHPNPQHRYLLRSVFAALDVKKVLGKAFGILGDAEADPQVRAHVLEMLTAWRPAFDDPRLPERAAKLLEDEDSRVRAAAARHFGARRKDEALPWLLELAGDPEPDVRAAALRAIRWYRAPKVNEALKTALGDPEAEVRAAALESLRTTASPDLAPRIRPFLKDPDPTVRSNAAQLLGRFGDRSALPTLLEILGQRDQDFLTRTMYDVLAALGKIGDPVAIEPLWKLLEDADRYPAIRNIRYRILSTIVTVGGVEIISKIRPYLADPTIQNRSYILDALSKLETEETIPILLDALKNGDARLRTSAVRGLARRDHREAAPLILKALGEETDTWFLTESVRALTAFEHREALPAMLELLDMDPADSSRTGLFYALLRAVDRFRVREAASRVAEIAAASQSYRYIGTDILGRLGNPAAAPTLLKTFEAEEDAVLKHRMARALARMGAREPLIAMCREQGPESGWSVEDLIALGRYDTAKARVVALLEKSPDNPARLYDLGCLLALTGEKDRAFEVLGRAFERPPVSRQHMLTDPDLDPLRDDPRFAGLLKKAR